MKNSCLLLMLAAALSLFSCSKDDDSNNPNPVTQTDPADDPAAIQLSSQLISANNWKLTGLTQGVPGQPIFSDIYNNSLPACQRDDVYTFNTTGNTVTVATGLAPCSPSETDKTGTWNLKNAKTLNISVPGITQAGLTGEFSIFMLDNSKMILRQTLNGNEYVATYEKNTVATRTQMLTARPWKITAMLQVDTYNGNTTTTDLYAQMAACSLDNFTVFQSNGTAVSDEGPAKCDPNDPQATVLSWAFTANETKLDINESGNSMTYDILSLTPSTLMLRYTYNFQGASSVTTITFTAQ